MSERGEIARMGGVAQKNSGRGSHAKGDVVLEPFLVDIKEFAKSFGVSVSNWAKLSLDAFKAGNREPAFMLALGEDGKITRVWVVSDEMFHQMRKAWLKENDGQ